MAKNKSPNFVLPDYDDPTQWSYNIEVLDDSNFIDRIAMGSYRVYLVNGGLVHGIDGWGWFAHTQKGAIKKGQRELRKYRRALERKRARQRSVDALHN